MILSLIFGLLFIIFVDALKKDFQDNNVFDFNLYEQVLDPQECERQMYFLSTNVTSLQMQFIDAGPRTPRGMLLGNFKDMGSYFECLKINENVLDMSIKGKYCMIQIPLQQEFEIPGLPEVGQEYLWLNALLKEINEHKIILSRKLLQDLQTYDIRKRGLNILLGQSSDKTTTRMSEDSQFAGINFDLAICIPDVCTTKQAIDIMTHNAIASLQISEAYCRLPNDKPWVAGDYVAIALFSIIGIVSVLSTFYDIRHSILLKKDTKDANKVYKLFSFYTNTKNFFILKHNTNSIHCLDGIRSLAMLWVIIGHTFAHQTKFNLWNPLAIGEFVTKFSSLWITTATITVDTFFMISGLLIVYISTSKISRTWLVKNLHMFYLNRLLRMFPVLAATILFQVSFMNWITDGPFWTIIADNTNRCRQNWWITLLYVQNFVDNHNMCLPHTWYLAIDMQMYIISPIVLFWVLGGNKRTAWIALFGALITVIAASTIYNFMMSFPALFSVSKPETTSRYMYEYYLHTLPRAAPFFVGMIFGYVMHLYRRRTVYISKMLNGLLWLLATAGTSMVIISTYFVIQPKWDNQTVNDIINSFKRPIWAVCIAWMVFACHHGYGGPVNWVLSLRVFKILGRLSFAMYIVHFNLIDLHNSIALSPIYFSVENSIYRFLVDVNLTMIAAFIVTIFIDSPFSGLIGIVLEGSKLVKKDDVKKDSTGTMYRISDVEISPKSDQL